MQNPRDEQEVYVWKKPDSPHWDLFARAAEKTLESWDLMEHALDEDWGGGEEAFEAILDNLLENFAEKWMQNKSTTLDAVCEFLDESMMDHFDAELDKGLSYPVARVLLLLFDECRRGKLDGAQYVLREELAAEAAANAPAATSTSGSDGTSIAHGNTTMMSSSEGSGGASVMDGTPPAATNSTEGVSSSSAAAATTTTRSTPRAVTDEDGWTTVTSSNKRGNQNKKSNKNQFTQ